MLAVLSMRGLCQGYEALLVLLDLVNRTPPAWLDIRPMATRTPLPFRIGDRRYLTDFYEPLDQVLAGIVLVPGAAPEGKDDPRVVSFATVLARCRFAVLVPDVVALRELRILPESARDVSDAMTYLLSRQDLAPAGRAGVVSTSVGIGPALLGMLDPSLSSRVRFILSIGGYYDLPRTLTYLTTGHYDVPGVSLRRQPSEYGKWVYVLSNASQLKNAREREIFRVLAQRKLANSEAGVEDLLPQLGPQGNRLYEFITNTDPARNPVLLNQLPSALRTHIIELDLASRDLTPLVARFILVHGFEDNTIPYGESIALAQALPPGRAKLYLLHGLFHVDVAPGIMDGFTMWRAIYALLSERYS